MWIWSLHLCLVRVWASVSYGPSFSTRALANDKVPYFFRLVRSFSSPIWQGVEVYSFMASGFMPVSQFWFLEGAFSLDSSLSGLNPQSSALRCEELYPGPFSLESYSFGTCSLPVNSFFVPCTVDSAFSLGFSLAICARCVECWLLSSILGEVFLARERGSRVPPSHTVLSHGFVCCFCFFVFDF